VIDKVKLALAVLCVVAGVAAYYVFPEAAQVLRVLMVLAGLVAGGAVAWFSEPGKQFFVFARESVAEAQRVSWPTRKETLQTTLVVFGFVVLMAAFLAIVDGSLGWAMKSLLGRGE
jgi:preprotein translocase subunit SecE